MRKKVAERQIVVESIPQRCFDALVDFESYPRWQSAIRACNVLTRDRDGRARRVAFEIAAKAGPISYTLDYSYEQPHLIAWEFVEGDVEHMDGEFVLEDQGDGTTLATFALRIDMGPRLSGTAASVLNEQVMQRSIEDLKARVERGA